MISKTIQPHPKPAVYISGGLDSTIILHHLREKCDGEIRTYTFGITSIYDEFESARPVADYYETEHREVYINDLLERYPEILRFFDKPMFNLWPYWLAEQAHMDGVETCYVGEGCDEHFGGYHGRGYLEAWSGHFEYILPTYQIVHKVFDLDLQLPYTKLDWRLTLPHWDPDGGKTMLRRAYRGVLPDWVVEKPKIRGGPDYWKLWKLELGKHFPGSEPKSEEDIRFLWRLWVADEWLRAKNIQMI